MSIAHPKTAMTGGVFKKKLQFANSPTLVI